MGTNYYWHEKPPCPTCQRPFEGLHIGKSSGGWTFGFQGTTEIRSYKDWLAKLETPNSFIICEYNRVVPLEDFKKLVEECLLWKGQPALNLARMATRPRSERNNAELEYCRTYPHSALFTGRTSLDENWLDPEGHSFSGYEFS